MPAPISMNGLSVIQQGSTLGTSPNPKSATNPEPTPHEPGRSGPAQQERSGNSGALGLTEYLEGRGTY